MAFVLGVAMRYASIETVHRMSAIIVFCLGNAILPAWTTLGSLAEKILLIFALLLGEVIGFAIDVHLRDQFLREHARDEALREAQAAAAELGRAAQEERESLLVQREAAAAEREAAAAERQAVAVEREAAR